MCAPGHGLVGLADLDGLYGGVVVGVEDDVEGSGAFDGLCVCVCG